MSCTDVEGLGCNGRPLGTDRATDHHAGRDLAIVIDGHAQIKGRGRVEPIGNGRQLTQNHRENTVNNGHPGVLFRPNRVTALSLRIQTKGHGPVSVDGLARCIGQAALVGQGNGRLVLSKSPTWDHQY